MQFQKTRWQEYWTQGKSAGGAYSIDKAKMAPREQQVYQAREYVSQALSVLDRPEEDLALARVLVQGALQLMETIDERENQAGGIRPSSSAPGVWSVKLGERGGSGVSEVILE